MCSHRWLLGYISFGIMLRPSRTHKIRKMDILRYLKCRNLHRRSVIPQKNANVSHIAVKISELPNVSVLHSYKFWEDKVINYAYPLVTLFIACLALCITYLDQQTHITKTSRNIGNGTAVRFQRYNKAKEGEQHTESKLFIPLLGDLRIPQWYSRVTSLLRCDFVSLGYHLTTFRMEVLSASSRIEVFKKNDVHFGSLNSWSLRQYTPPKRRVH
jgi:hypothetical protein